MTDDIAGDDARYWAFISYSHRDAAFGRRLHRRLENYALPRRLVGRDTAQGAVPKKLAPIFRDREELPAAHDLSTEVRAALKASRSLIVVCSPSSAASQWVGREIEVFRELHPGRPILAAVRDASRRTASQSPARHRPRRRPDRAAGRRFPPRPDGEQLGLLKLVAGIIGLGLGRAHPARRASPQPARDGRHGGGAGRGDSDGRVDGLRAERKVRSGPAAGRSRGTGRIHAHRSSRQAQRRRTAGRDDGGQRAGAQIYSDKDLSKLPVDSLERRARIFHAMGEDDETRGDHDAALAEFAKRAVRQRHFWQTIQTTPNGFSISHRANTSSVPWTMPAAIRDRKVRVSRLQRPRRSDGGDCAEKHEVPYGSGLCRVQSLLGRDQERFRPSRGAEALRRCARANRRSSPASRQKLRKCGRAENHSQRVDELSCQHGGRLQHQR